MTDQTYDSSTETPLGWVVPAAIAGILAGVVFAMFEMVMAAVLSGPAAFFMPLRMIGGIGLGKSALDPATSLVTAGGVGLVIHMALSMMYGVGLALLGRVIPSLRASRSTVVETASAAGLILWVVNFKILAHLVGWDWFPDGTNALVQIVAHTVFFGTALGLFLTRLDRGLGKA